MPRLPHLPTSIIRSAKKTWGHLQREKQQKNNKKKKKKNTNNNNKNDKKKTQNNTNNKNKNDNKKTTLITTPTTITKTITTIAKTITTIAKTTPTTIRRTKTTTRRLITTPTTKTKTTTTQTRTITIMKLSGYLVQPRFGMSGTFSTYQRQYHKTRGEDSKALCAKDHAELGILPGGTLLKDMRRLSQPTLNSGTKGHGFDIQ